MSNKRNAGAESDDEFGGVDDKQRNPPQKTAEELARMAADEALARKAQEEEDKKFVEAGADEKAQKQRRDAIDLIIMLNGETAHITPGTAMTYIPEDNFYRRVNGSNGSDTSVQLVENALNWAALGKNKAAVYGASIRWALRDSFDLGRETKVVNVDFKDVKADVKALIDGYTAALRPVVKQAAFWGANANNVAALSGALMVSAGHHYDSQNTRPQSALVGALGQSEDIDADSYRVLFYLTVHPLPLHVIERKRFMAASGRVSGYSEAVRIRCNGVPSGYGALAIAAAAFDGMAGEKFYRPVLRKYGEQINLMLNKLREVKQNPTAFHVNATDYGVQRRFMELGDVKEAMVIGIAYARYVIKGTMQKAASAKKFYDQHKKAVETWGQAFEAAAEAGASTLEELLA